MIYKATDYYAPQRERTLVWNDPTLKIIWPIPAGEEPILLVKDRAGNLLPAAEVYEQEIK